MTTFHGIRALAAGVAAAGLLTGCAAGGFGSDPAPPADAAITSYVALGDDFTAAPGTGRTVGDDGCQRSDAAYPALLADKLRIQHVADVSCVGATTRALTAEDKPGKGKPAVPAQLDAVRHDTDLVTIGVGLADRDLLQHAFEACTKLPCGADVTPPTVLEDAKATGEALATAIRAIQDRAPDAYVVVVGYPTIVPDAGSCNDLPKLGERGRAVARILLADVEREIRSTARQTGTAYADIAQLSVGHELCSDDPWIQGGPDGRGGSVSYRPSASEQKAVAGAVADLVRSR